MKKIVGSLIAVLFCLAIAVAPASADMTHVEGHDGISILYNHGDLNDGGYAYGRTHNTYNATSYGQNDALAFGMSRSKGKVKGFSGQTDLFGFGDVGYSRSHAEVGSFAETYTCPCGYNRSTVSGYVAQANWSDAQAGPGTWAVGGNYSDASYRGVDYSCWNSHLSGDAETRGFTLTGAYTRQPARCL